MGRRWKRKFANFRPACAAGSLTAEALLDRCLERIRQLDPQLNSFVALDEAGARAAAKASDARLAGGTARSALEGIPLSVKDNIHAAGLPTTWGSRALAGVLPDGDELPVARLRAAGAVVVGKTNVPELTLEGYTKNDLFGVTRNPWDTRLTPGGSSGGAAAGVAAGLVPAAIGTDGGGSVRRPACHTGLVGWKPSTGRIPRVDGLPAILTDFETIGTLTRSIDDALLLDSAMAGPDARDHRSLYAATPHRPEGRWRIIYIPQFGDAPVDPEVMSVTAGVAEALAREGYQVQEEKVFFDLEDAARIWHVISRAGVAWLMGRGDRTARRDGRRFGAGDGGRRRKAHGSRLHRCARAGCRLPPPLCGIIRQDRFRSHADGRGFAVAGCDTVSGSDRGSPRRPPRSCRVHRLGEHRRPSSDQPAGSGLATRPPDRRSVREPGSLATPPCSHSPRSSRAKIRRLRFRV